MNFLLFLYLNLVRGPRLMEERQKREDAARLAQAEADIQSGKVLTCKKCDAKIDLAATKNVEFALTQRCGKCIAAEAEEKKRVAQETVESFKMTPFLWFQVFGIVMALIMFFHRNVMPLF